MNTQNSFPVTGNSGLFFGRSWVAIALRMSGLVLLMTATAIQAQFIYKTNNGSLTLADCDTSFAGVADIPARTNGLTVTSIGSEAFAKCEFLTCVHIPDPVTNIGKAAFDYCPAMTNVTIPDGVTGSFGSGMFWNCGSLAAVTIPKGVTNLGDYACGNCVQTTAFFFKGDAPSLGKDVFTNDTNATVYYLPGTTGWGATFGGLPTCPWNPQFQTGDSGFGMRSNRFGFNVTGTANIPIVVDACTDLANSVWVTVQSCTLTNGSFYFADTDWTNHPGRFYRIRWP